MRPDMRANERREFLKERGWSFYWKDTGEAVRKPATAPANAG